jgi:ribonuclease HI
MAKMTNGIKAPYMRKLYLAVAVPRMMYGADLFLTPYRRNHTIAPSTQSSYNTTLIKTSMATIQRKATIMITGAMKTTATAALDAMANILPFHLLVDRIRHQAVLRMATLPKEHHLHKIISRASTWCYVKSHPSPIHELLFTYNIKPKHFETISAVRNTNRYRIQANVKVDDTKERAIEAEENDRAEIRIYTDGSATNGKVGAAAVIYRKEKRIKTLWKHLGSDEEHTVYEAECTGILMGLHAIKRWKYKRTTIYADNQAALQGLTANEPGPGKYLLDAIHNEIGVATKKKGKDNITLRWIPGHQGVEGNEAADVEAKRATEGRTSSKKDLPKILQKHYQSARRRKNRDSTVNSKKRAERSGNSTQRESIYQERHRTSQRKNTAKNLANYQGKAQAYGRN